MKMTMTQTIKQIDFAEYDVVIELPNGELYANNFKRSNEVHPAYRTLMIVLRAYENATIHIKTNCKPLATEFNAIVQNPHAALLQNLKAIIARRNLDVTIEYVA